MQGKKMPETSNTKQKILDRLNAVGGGSLLLVSIFKYKSAELKFAEVMSDDEAVAALEMIIREVVAVAIADDRKYAWAGDLWDSPIFLQLSDKRKAYVYGILIEQFQNVLSECIVQKIKDENADEVALFWGKVLELAEQNLPPFVPTKDIYEDEKDTYPLLLDAVEAEK
jgi:hypothetical protein